MFRPSTIVLFLAACTGASPVDDDVDGTETDPVDTTEDYYPEGVDFELRVGDRVVSCGDELPALGTPPSTPRLVDAKAYVSNLVLSGPTSGTFAFAPEQDSTFQHGAVALVDFEDASGLCQDFGTPATHTHVSGYIPEGDWDTLTFDLGLDHTDAHQPIDSAAPPLDEHDLYRSAQLGRLFLKVVVGGSGGVDDFHADIGSSGCDSANAQTPPELPCTRPAVATVSVPFAPFASGVRPVVVLDLANLLVGVDLTHNEAGPPGCQSMPDDTYECAPIYASLGMSFGTATCVDDCSGQVAFRAVCRSLDDGSEVPCP